MAIERYARGEAKVDDISCHPGVEYRDGDDVDEMTHHIQAAALFFIHIWHGNHVELATSMRRWIERNYPDRAYFVETEEEGRGVQVYDPKDFVKERCPCGTTCRRT